MKKNPKIGICGWSLPAEEEEKPEILKTLGLDGMELNFVRNDEGIIELDNRIERNKLKKRLNESSLEYFTLGVNELCSVGMSLKENSIKAVELLQRAIDAALDLECKILQVPSFVQGMINNREELENTIACFEKACLYAGNSPLIISTENSLGATDNLTMVNAINRDNFKIYFDTQNPHLFGVTSVPDMIEPLFSHICEVHLKDGDGAFGNCLMGEGKAETEKTVRKLLSKGYSGWFHFENSYQSLSDNRNMAPLDLVKKDINWIKQIMESVN